MNSEVDPWLEINEFLTLSDTETCESAVAALSERSDRRLEVQMKSFFEA